MNLGKAVVRHKRAILILALILLIPSVIGMIGTRINYDMLTYLPDDFETMKGQDVLIDEFGKGGFSIIVVEDMKTDEVSDMVSKMEQVDHVDSVINLQKLIDPSVPAEMYPDIIKDNFDKENTTMLVVFFDSTTSDEGTLEAVSELRSIGKESAYVSGMSALVLDLKNLTEAEEAKYVAVAVILSLAAMMLLIDSYVAPLLFLASIGIAILYNLGTNIVFGETSFVTKAIAAVLQLGVTMDYSIFLWHSYMEKLDLGSDEDTAMEEAINATLVSVTGSSITTIAGFLALCFMSYTMGKDLGIVMAKGVVFGVICSVTVLPVLLLKFTKVLRRTRHKSLIPDMSRAAHALTSHYIIFILIFAVMVVPAIIGYNKDNITYDFTKLAAGQDDADPELLAQLTFLDANHKLEDAYGISTSYIIIADADLPAKDGKAMAKELDKVDGVVSVLGVDALLGTSIPKAAIPSELKDSLTSEEHQMILVNGAYRVSTEECNAQLDEVNRIAHKYDPASSVIGEAPATKDLIELTSKDFTVVNWISIAMVFLIIFIVLRSASLPFILIATIEFAIYVNLAISGFTGLEMPFLVPICISTIQLGSTVDYAILMSTRYKTERMEGKEKREAIDTAAAASIPSIIVSALGFFTATFGVAVYSNITIISTLCSMMARGALISMASVILVLPSLLMACDGIICRSTLGMRHLKAKGNTGNDNKQIAGGQQA